MSSTEGPWDEPGSARPKTSWRGRTSGRSAEARRQWRRDPASSLKSSRGSSRIPVGARVAVVLVSTVVCLASYVALILARPAQVALIALTAPPYPDPLPPNAWSKEDVDGLSDLDGETITLHDGRGACGSRSAILAALAEHLDRAATVNAHGPLILYLNMHAAVDGKGKPCLIPPRASSVDSSTWLPVADVFSTLAGHPRSSRRDVVVILDTNRLDAEWRLGIARNTFVERLKALMDSGDGPRRRSPSLAVLTAAGVDEVSHVSRDLGGSAFAHFLRRGLSGRADERADGGNGDSRVSLRELYAYLLETVPEWSRRNRDASQVPLLCAAEGVDFPLTWACRESLPERLAPQAPVAAADIATLWERAEALNRRRPIRYAPLLWSDLRRSIQYLERAADAGDAYAATARLTAEELTFRLSALEKLSADPEVAPWNVFTSDDAALRVEVPARSLALRRAFGRDDGPQRAAWEAATAGPAPGDLGQLAARIEIPEAGPTDEAQFLKLIAASPAATAPAERLGRAVVLHRLGESAAAPKDVRAWPWVRDFVRRGDQGRRAVEDSLLAGQPPDPAAYAAAESAYREAIATADSIAESLSLLDEVRHDQVLFARWLTSAKHHRSDDDRPDLNNELIDAVLLPTIEEAKLLGGDLEASGGGTVAGQEARRASLQRSFGRLRDEFDKAYARLLEEPKRTAETLREIDLVLCTPLLPSRPWNAVSPAGQRVALLAKRAAIARDLSLGPPAAGTRAKPETLSQLASHWRRHPLVALVESGSSDPLRGVPQSVMDVADAERVGEFTRAWLGGLSLAVAQVAPRSDGTSPDGEGGTAALRRLVSQLRVAAALRDLSRDSDPDPVARLTGLDLATLLVGQAERKLDDFWGPAEAQGEPYFLVAAEDLHAAKSLGALDAGLIARVEELERLLDARQKAASAGLRLRVSDVVLAVPGQEESAVVAIRPGPDPSAVAMPDGKAAVVAGRPEACDPSKVRPVVLPVPSDGAVVELPVAAGPHDPASRSDRVTLLFRGHRFEAPLTISVPAGPTVELSGRPAAPTTLTLRSENRQGLSVVFVLDCSASMAEPARAEGFGPSSDRLDLAGEALSRMLAELSARPRTRVGVVFYGHRVGWRRVESAEGAERFQRSPQSGYRRPIPDTVMPYDDVEVVEPLGRFDGSVAGEVEASLESIRPWGETPLYLAIDTALRQFDEADTTAERSVIVITDGLNEQSNPSAAARKTPADVLATWQRRKAAIEIIGFGLAAGDAGRAAAEFGRFAEATGGSYESAGQATDLISALERRLGPATYRVTSPRAGDAVTAAIGRPVDLDVRPSVPAPFRVESDGESADVSAEGGEAIDLIATDTGRIVSARYLSGSPLFAALRSGEPSRRSGVSLGLHRPVRMPEAGVTFEFSLQRDDQVFCPRPGAVWIEATPIGKEGAAAIGPYVFFHREFQPGTPVPVLRWTASDWPAEADAASVRFWCRDEPVAPAGSIRLSDLLGGGAARSLAGLDEVQFEAYTVDEAGDVRIDVVERHSAGSPGVGRVAVIWSGPSPRRTVHRFDETHDLALHSFRFEPGVVVDPTTCSLEVFTREAVEAGGFRLDTPVAIDVSDQTDLLVPFRAPSSSPDPSTDDSGAPPAAASGEAPGEPLNRSSP